MQRSSAIPALVLTFVALIGCGGTSTPTFPLPSATPMTVKVIEPTGPSRQIQRQITVMGKNGPKVVTITETVNGGTENPRRLPFDASPPETRKTQPTPKEQ